MYPSAVYNSCNDEIVSHIQSKWICWFCLSHLLWSDLLCQCPSPLELPNPSWLVRYCHPGFRAALNRCCPLHRKVEHHCMDFLLWQQYRLAESVGIFPSISKIKCAHDVWEVLIYLFKYWHHSVFCSFMFNK